MANYRPQQIANYFIKKHPEDDQLSPMKLLKLVYFSDGWFRAFEKQPLVDEMVEAWTYGPVYKSLYDDLKKSFEPSILSNDRLADIQDKRVQSFLDWIWQVYGSLGPIQISNLTHSEDSPWYKVYKERSGNLPRGLDIPEKYIEEYFEKLMKKALEVKAE
jgi:uncharacterized phage-associated protein